MIDEQIAIAALIINTIVLLYVIHQNRLANESLRATKKSIDDSKRQRQLEILPKFTWVIKVQGDLQRWGEDLKEKQDNLLIALINRDKNILKELSDNYIKNPKDLMIDKFLYDRMPPWLKEIWMSGAQYYYDAMASMQYLFEEKNIPRYSLAETLKDRCADSEEAINILLKYIKDMVPPVILNTPASLSDNNFITD